jgi:dynein light chain Tctex-type 1
MAQNNEEEVDEFNGFTTEEADAIQLFMNEFFQGQVYEDTKSIHMMEEALEQIMKILYEFKKPYKYIVDCMITQRVGAGMTNYTSAIYERNLDFIYHFYYPPQPKEKSLIFVLVTIFAVSYSSKN